MPKPKWMDVYLSCSALHPSAELKSTAHVDKLTSMGKSWQAAALNFNSEVLTLSAAKATPALLTLFFKDL